MEIKLNMWDNNVSHCSNIKEAGLRCGVRNNKIPIDYSQKFIWETKKEIFSFTHSKGVTVFTDKYFHPKIINVHRLVQTKPLSSQALFVHYIYVYI